VLQCSDVLTKVSVLVVRVGNANRFYFLLCACVPVMLVLCVSCVASLGARGE